MSGLICSGNVYINVYENGVLTGERGPFNATAFSIAAPKSKTVDRKSYQRDDYGTIVDSTIIPDGASVFSAQFDDADPEAIALITLGTVTSETENAGSVVGEIITAHAGRWTKLAHRNISALVVKAHPASVPVSPPTIVGTGTGTMTGLSAGTATQAGNYVVTLTETSPTAAFSVVAPDGTSLSAGHVGTPYTSAHVNFSIATGGTMTTGDHFTIACTATSFTNGTDYISDTTSGMIKVLVTSNNIDDGDSVQVNYSYGALSAEKILAGQVTTLRSQVRLDGVNLSNQKKVEVVIPEVPLMPSGDLSLIGDKYMSFKLSGNIVNRDGEQAPYYYREID